MSDQSAVQALLARLFKCSGTISSTYYNTRIAKNEENASDIGLLRQVRLLSPDIRDTFQLRASFRQFLNTTLSTERLFAIGANVGDHFARLEKLVNEHAYAIQEGRDAAAEQYEVEIREAISDIADAVDDELTVLHAMVATKFAAVSTIAEKRRQNLHYQDRTRKLVALLENFHFADFAEQLAGNEDLALSFRALLEDRLPTFREKLKAVLHQLQQYLFEYRKIEDRARLVRSFALHLNRNPDWAPRNWDEAATPPEWVRLATPLQLACHADVTQPESEDILREIAATIPAYAEARVERRPFVSWTRSRTKRWWWSSTPRSRKQCVRTSQTPSPVPSGSPPDTGGVSTRHWSAPSGKTSGSFAWCPKTSAAARRPDGVSAWTPIRRRTSTGTS